MGLLEWMVLVALVLGVLNLMRSGPQQQQQITSGVLVPLPPGVSAKNIGVDTRKPGNPFGCRLIAVVVHDHGKATYVYDYGGKDDK